MPTKEHIHAPKAKELDMKEGQMDISNVSFKDTHYMKNCGLIHVTSASIYTHLSEKDSARIVERSGCGSVVD